MIQKFIINIIYYNIALIILNACLRSGDNWLKKTFFFFIKINCNHQNKAK